MKLFRKIPVLATLVLLAAAACGDATGPRLPDDGTKPDLPPPTGATSQSPAA